MYSYFRLHILLDFPQNTIIIYTKDSKSQYDLNGVTTNMFTDTFCRIIQHYFNCKWFACYNILSLYYLRRYNK